jgi:predicted amidohydrolase
MAKLQVRDNRKRQVLLNTDLITRAIFAPNEENQDKTHLFLYFDGENRVVCAGDEARRVWDLLTGKGEFKVNPLNL